MQLSFRHLLISIIAGAWFLTGQTLAVADNAETIKWVDLIPEKERELLANPPQSLGEIPDGSPADKIAGKLKAGLGDPDSAYHQALVSTNVVDTLRGKLIRIPGFIVPLEFTDDDKIKRFFLVPYFGACLHYPPPPPNQIIYAENADGIEFTFDPVWSTGYLQVSLIENDVATAAYHLKNIKVEVYD